MSSGDKRVAILIAAAIVLIVAYSGGGTRLLVHASPGA